MNEECWTFTLPETGISAHLDSRTLILLALLVLWLLARLISLLGMFFTRHPRAQEKFMLEVSAMENSEMNKLRAESCEPKPAIPEKRTKTITPPAPSPSSSSSLPASSKNHPKTQLAELMPNVPLMPANPSDEQVVESLELEVEHQILVADEHVGEEEQGNREQREFAQQQQQQELSRPQQEREQEFEDVKLEHQQSIERESNARQIETTTKPSQQQQHQHQEKQEQKPFLEPLLEEVQDPFKKLLLVAFQCVRNSFLHPDLRHKIPLHHLTIFRRWSSTIREQHAQPFLGENSDDIHKKIPLDAIKAAGCALCRRSTDELQQSGLSVHAVVIDRDPLSLGSCWRDMSNVLNLCGKCDVAGDGSSTTFLDEGCRHLFENHEVSFQKISPFRKNHLYRVVAHTERAEKLFPGVQKVLFDFTEPDPAGLDARSCYCLSLPRRVKFIHEFVDGVIVVDKTGERIELNDDANNGFGGEKEDEEIDYDIGCVDDRF